MSDQFTNPFVLPGMGQNSDLSGNPVGRSSVRTQSIHLVRLYHRREDRARRQS